MPTAGEYKHVPAGTPCHCCVKRRIRYTSSFRRKSCLRKPSVSSYSLSSDTEQTPYSKFKKVTFNPVLSVCSYDDDSNENFKVLAELHDATEQLPNNPTTASARRTASTREHFPVEKTSCPESRIPQEQKCYPHVPPLPEYDNSSETRRDIASLEYNDDSALLDDFSEIAYWDSDEESEDEITLTSSERSSPVPRNSKQNSLHESHFKSEPHSDYFTGQYTFSPASILDEVDSCPLLGHRGLKSQVSLCSNRRVTLRRLNLNTLKATSAAFFGSGCVFLVAMMYVFLFMCSGDDVEDCA